MPGDNNDKKNEAKANRLLLFEIGLGIATVALIVFLITIFQ